MKFFGKTFSLVLLCISASNNAQAAAAQPVGNPNFLSPSSRWLFHQQHQRALQERLQEEQGKAAHRQGSDTKDQRTHIEEEVRDLADEAFTLRKRQYDELAPILRNEEIPEARKEYSANNDRLEQIRRQFRGIAKYVLREKIETDIDVNDFLLDYLN